MDKTSRYFQRGSAFVGNIRLPTKKATTKRIPAATPELPLSVFKSETSIIGENSLTLRPTFTDFLLVEKDPRAIFPYTFVTFSGNNSEAVAKVVRPRGFLRIHSLEDSLPENVNFFYKRVDQINQNREPTEYVVLNHLENVRGICTKTGLIKSLRKYYGNSVEACSCHYSAYDSIPTSFILLSNSQEADYNAFIQRFKELNKGHYAKERLPAKHCQDNVWLIKPAALNQGRGIQFFRDDLDGMKKFIASKPALSHWVVQKYIEQPMLYKGRKFDFRVWALITHKLELWAYKSGYIRTSSDQYTLDSNYNYVHLTNNCLQQHGNKYGFYEEGNTLSFEALQKYLFKEFPSVNLEKDIVPRMKDLMIDTFLSIKSEINPSRRKNCFELLGFDFMLDEDFRVWLIEVNTNPYLGIPNKFIEGLLPKMINDLLEKVLDPYFKPANPMPKKDVKNGFELLYSDAKKINVRRPFTTVLYPVAGLAGRIHSTAPSMLYVKKAIIKNQKPDDKDYQLAYRSTMSKKTFPSVSMRRADIERKKITSRENYRHRSIEIRQRSTATSFTFMRPTKY